MGQDCLPQILLCSFLNTFTQMLLWCCLIHNYHHTKKCIVFSIFASIFMRRSIYVISIRCIFHFQVRFHYNESYNLIKAGIIIFCRFLKNISAYFQMIIWMKKVNNFKIAVIQSHGAA